MHGNKNLIWFDLVDSSLILDAVSCNRRFHHLRINSVRERRAGSNHQLDRQNDVWTPSQNCLGPGSELDYCRLYPWLRRWETAKKNTQILSGIFNLYWSWSKFMIGFVNRFLSWRGFLPLSRLTYCVYLIHYDYLNVFYSMSRKMIYYTFLDQLTTFFGITVTVFGLAFLVSVCVEAPFINLERWLFMISTKTSNNKN